MTSEHDRVNELDIRHFRRPYIYGFLDLQYISQDNGVLKTLYARDGSEMAELCSFDAVVKRQ